MTVEATTNKSMKLTRQEESAWNLDDAWDIEIRNKLIHVLDENK